MTTEVQFIYGDQKDPLFAVLPYAAYTKLISPFKEETAAPVNTSLLSTDKLNIRLPHGGGASIDVVQLVDYCQQTSLVSMAVGARQQRLSKFPHDHIASLDPMLRMCFLPVDSPYRNTMQATNDVVEALVQTGVFKLTKRDFNNAKEGQSFYRPVQALDFLEDSAKEFMKDKQRPKNPIPRWYWTEKPYNSGWHETN